MKKISLLISLLVITTACTTHHSAPAVKPETLLNSSSEKISFPITGPESVSAIESWISSSDAPATAEISCGNSGKNCDKVRKLLTSKGIKVSTAAAQDSAGNVSITYNRLIARNCTTVHFGCSTATNSIQMVTNRDQFIKPAMSDMQDAASAVRALHGNKRRFR